MNQRQGPVGSALAQLDALTLVRVEESSICGEEYRLSATEERRLAGAVLKRRREFRTGRHLATLACAGWGLARPSLEPDRQGDPRWPDGFVGSITHCDTWAAAAVARRAEVAALGIDAEPAEPLMGDIVGAVLQGVERQALERQSGLQAYSGCPDRLVFCAKEAVFKAWYQLRGGGWLDFCDVEIVLRPDGSWTAHGGPAAAEVRWAGGWSVCDGIAAAALLVR